MAYIMDVGSTILARNPPQSNLSSSKDYHTELQGKASPVHVQAVGGICTAERNTTLSPGELEGPKQRQRPTSEPVINFRGNRFPRSSLGSVHVLNRHSVNANIENGTIREDERHVKSHPNEQYKLQRPKSSGSQGNPVGPIKFVRRWAKTHLPSDESSAQLRKKLSAITVKNHFQERFIPEDRLREIVTAETVCAELKRSNYSNLRRIHARPVTVEDGTRYQKILAILYLIKMPSKIRKFVKHSVCDQDLPLVECENSKGGSSPRLKSVHDSTIRTIRFKRQEDMKDFIDSQWKVLAPVFPRSSGGRIWHRRLVPETILPFVSHGSSTAQGGYSKVLKTEIYPTYHEFGDENVFAVKVLKKCDQKAFKQEAAILGRLSNPYHTHEHLITLLATFEHRQIFHFIFPWADADLFTFWKRQSDPPNGEKIETWIIEQCYGLADALNTIHRYETMSGTTLIEGDHVSQQIDDNGEQQLIGLETSGPDHPLRSLFGRHGDLKPENILWFPCPTSSGGHGILKITDFGAARFNTVNLWDTRKTGRIPNSATYRSPEIDLHGRLTTACDVWALGCVYLQFITWFCGGNSRLQDFGQRRLADDPKMVNMPSDTFFSLIQEGELMRAEVKPAVVDEIEQLWYHSRCTKRFKTLLNIIQEDMLVVHQEEASSGHQKITPGIRKLVGSTSFNESDSISIRRKSCGNIWRRIGDIIHTKDQEGNLTRHDTFESTPSPVKSTSLWLSKDGLNSILNAIEVPSCG